MSHPAYVYLDDRVVPWDEGKVHIASVGFKFGTGVFEGLRAYWNAEKEQMFVLQLAEHMHRLEYSQKFMRFDEILPRPRRRRADPGAPAGKRVQAKRPHHVHGLRSGVRPAVDDGPDRPLDSRRSEAGHPLDRDRLHRPHQLLAAGARYRHADAGEVQCQLPERAAGHVAGAGRRIRHRHSPQQPRQGGGRSGHVPVHGPGRQGGDSAGDQRHPGKHHAPDRDDALPRISRHGGDRARHRPQRVRGGGRGLLLRHRLGGHDPLVSVDRLPIGDGKVGPTVRGLQDVFFDIATGARDDHSEWRTPVYG